MYSYIYFTDNRVTLEGKNNLPTDQVDLNFNLGTFNFKAKHVPQCYSIPHHIKVGKSGSYCAHPADDNLLNYFMLLASFCPQFIPVDRESYLPRGSVKQARYESVATDLTVADAGSCLSPCLNLLSHAIYPLTLDSLHLQWLAVQPAACLAVWFLLSPWCFYDGYWPTCLKSTGFCLFPEQLVCIPSFSLTSMLKGRFSCRHFTT